MKDILMIALEFAPVPSTGAYRVIELVKRLPSLGIRPIVVTIETEQAEKIFGAERNLALLEGLPPEVRVVHIRSKVEPAPETSLKRLFRMMTTLDDTFERRFAADLMSVVSQLKAEYDLKAVYVTAPPFGATHLGTRVAHELGLPLLLDMRDAWAEWTPAPRVTRLHYKRQFADERRAFEAANRIISVTPETRDLFRATHPHISVEHFAVVPNGIPNLEGIADTVEWRDDGDILNVGYVGAFYYNPPKPASWRAPHRYLQYDPRTEDWSYRSPLYFFRAWAALQRQSPEKAARIRFHLVGIVPDWLPGMAEEYGVLDRCVFHGLKPRTEIPRFLDSMTCLLATSAKRISGKDYSLASKSFEYIKSGRPILAFVCDGAQRRFFKSAGGAFFFNPDDPEQSGARLDSLTGIREYLSVNTNYLLSYALDRTSAKMAKELLALTKEANSGDYGAP